jgi:hypothetical protein
MRGLFQLYRNYLRVGYTRRAAFRRAWHVWTEGF